MKALMADGKILLCDRCDTNPAQYYVSGLSSLSFYDGLCANCCAQWLREKGDIAGAEKFEKAGA